jgi:hypothetical protein
LGGNAQEEVMSKLLSAWQKFESEFLEALASEYNAEDEAEYIAPLRSAILEAAQLVHAPDAAYASACKVCGKPVGADGHLDLADIGGVVTITAAYCGYHWQKLGE